MMRQEDLVDAVNKIHADMSLKDKVMSGKSAAHEQKPNFPPLFKYAACFAVMAVIVLGATLVPRVLNPIGTVAQSSQAQSSSASLDSGQLELVNGLYHDDAITNILILGVDDYLKNDVGRSDSMMLVSVDTRHKKLKVTSFMRDMYVNIPGIGNNRINSAYFLSGGGAEGAKKVVFTIEANFGIDIDHFMIISNAAFDQIIDKLGGVSITLTAGEAKLVNQYSGDSRRNLTAGTFVLSGAQAHYYSRIRAIGDEFARTERQRKVFISLADKYKTTDIGTISNALSETLHLVTTNMTKNEVFGMAEQSLTYLNYPVSQKRIPGENEFRSANVTINSCETNVLVPDLKKCRESVLNFIYEQRCKESS